MHHQTSHHPYAAVLRQRAGHLCELAATIERSLVMNLPEAVDRSVWPPSTSAGRIRLCERLLEANLRQLHQAADDLRMTAHRFRRRAEEFDRAHRQAA